MIIIETVFWTWNIECIVTKGDVLYRAWWLYPSLYEWSWVTMVSFSCEMRAPTFPDRYTGCNMSFCEYFLRWSTSYSKYKMYYRHMHFEALFSRGVKLKCDGVTVKAASQTAVLCPINTISASPCSCKCVALCIYIFLSLEKSHSTI